MPQPKRGYTLGSNPSHQRLMLRTMAASLFEHERIRTTEAKAKALRPYAERLITKAKKGTVHHRRQVLSDIEDRAIVHKLFDDIGPRFAERNGGYTRILKLGHRSGDGAPMALIELVQGSSATTVESSPSTGRRRGLRRPRRPAGEAAPAGTANDSKEEDSVETEAVADEEPVASDENTAEEASDDSGDDSDDDWGDDSSTDEAAEKN
ncbi:MAG: 50S ribosomal protein L17 [Actinomycetota bacterium]|nr:50S ribosomal protein L17 [Actinomycetota bacterium]